jgi:hypothetical protein
MQNLAAYRSLKKSVKQFRRDLDLRDSPNPFDVTGSIEFDMNALKLKVLVIVRNSVTRAIVDIKSPELVRLGIRFWIMLEKDNNVIYIRLNRTEDNVFIPTWFTYTGSSFRCSILSGDRIVLSQIFAMDSSVTCRTETCILCWNFIEYSHCQTRPVLAIAAAIPLATLIFMIAYLKSLVIGVIWIVWTVLRVIRMLLFLPFRIVRWMLSLFFGNLGRPRSASSNIIRTVTIICLFIKFCSAENFFFKEVRDVDVSPNLMLFSTEWRSFACDEIVFLPPSRFSCSDQSCKMNLRGLTFDFGNKNVTSCVADEAGRALVAVTLMSVDTRIEMLNEYFTSDRNISVYSETFCEDSLNSNLPYPRYCLDGLTDTSKTSSTFLSNYTQLDEALKDPYFIDFYNRANFVLESQSRFHIGSRSCGRGRQPCQCLNNQKRTCSYSGIALQPRGDIFQVLSSDGMERVYDVMIEVITPTQGDGQMQVMRGKVSYPEMSVSDGDGFFDDNRVRPVDVFYDRVVDNLGDSQSQLICNSKNGFRLVNRANTKDWWCAEANVRGEFKPDIIGDLQSDIGDSLVVGSGFEFSESSLITTETQDSFSFETKPSRIVELSKDDLTFPAVIGDMLWTSDIDGILTSDRFSDEHIRMSLSSNLATWTFSSQIPQVCPEVTFKSLTGCYNCQLGAILRLEVKSTCDGGLGWLESSVLTSKATGLVKWLDGGKALPKDDGKLRLAFFATKEIQTFEFRVFYNEPTMMDIFYIYPKIKGLSEPRSVLVQATLSVPTTDILIPDSTLIGLNDSEITDELKRREDIYYIFQTRANWTMTIVQDQASLALEYRKILLTVAIVVFSMAIVYLLTTRPKRDTVVFKIWMKMMTSEDFEKLTLEEKKNYIEYHSKKQKN